MIRIRVFKAYELAVAFSALLLIAALIFLFVSAFSQEEGTQVSAPAPVEMPASGVTFAQNTQEAALAVFSSALAPVFVQDGALHAQGEVIALRVEGEGLIAWASPPRVLIYHTHTYEAYTMEADGLYAETEQWRTADSEYNVVRVGEALAEELRLRGIEVVHDVTDHELPTLNTAYARSLETLNCRFAGGETYDLCIDLHRDAYIASNGANTVDTPTGKAAKCMFLIGTGANFAQKPDSEANADFAWRLTEQMNGQVPGICRDVLVRENRYNQHLGDRALLLEAGNNMNTLSEVLRAMPYLADSIAKSLLEEESAAPEAEYLVVQNIK